MSKNKKNSFSNFLRRFFYIFITEREALIFPITLMAVLSGLILSVGIIFRDSLNEPISMQENEIFFVLVLIPVVLATTVYMLKYLSTSRDFRENIFDRKASEIRYQIKKNKFSDHGNIDYEKYKNLILERIKSEATEEYLKTIEKKLKSAKNEDKVISFADETKQRIYDEIESLGKRGNLNLVLGILTALSGILVLAYLIFTTDMSEYTVDEFIISYTPRISIAIIIEVFSYFFLRLYKRNLNEIKYFQNEATGIELKYAGLYLSMSLKDEELIKSSVNSLINTDRNQTILKSEP